MSTRRRLLMSGVLLAIASVSVIDRPRAQAPAAILHGIGYLADGAASSIVRDATRHDNVLYAVGGSGCSGGQPVPCSDPDTAVLWTLYKATATLQPLPDLVLNTLGLSPLSAFDITSDGAFIASQARSQPNGPLQLQRQAVRVATSQLPSAAANLNLTAAPFPVLAPNTSAVAISSDLDATTGATGRFVYVNDGTNRGLRLDTHDFTSAVIPKLAATDTANPVTIRGTSLNGNVAIGASVEPPSPQFPAGRRKPYRYVHSAGVASPIPPLRESGFGIPVALSADGNLVFVTGDSDQFPNGEAYVYRASTGQTTRLGSPDSKWLLGGRLCAGGVCNQARAIAGGIALNGTVVAMNFTDPSNQAPGYAYFRNQYGWFHLTSALAANGVDLAAGGWTKNFVLQGISRDATLAYGAGERNGHVEGFVAELSPTLLSTFNPQAAAPLDPSLVGVWTFSDPANPGHVVVFTEDGVYYHIDMEGSGFERGLYTFDGARVTFTTLLDTNGLDGLSDANGFVFQTTVTGDTLTADDGSTGHRITGAAGSIVGAWVAGNPTQRDNSAALVFLANGRYAVALDDSPFGNDDATTEIGSYSWNPVTRQLDISPDGGTPSVGNSFTPSPDERAAVLVFEGSTDSFTRIIDPRTPRITSATSATATTGLPFAYQLAATSSPSLFNAIGLPVGLTINPATGLVSGAPAEFGAFEILLEASNTLSTITGRNRLSLTVLAPVVVGTGATTVTPIAPASPGEPPPVTLEFTNVTSGGTISVATIDPAAASQPPPPAGFSLGDSPVYFEITPSPGLTFSGPVKVCFSYAGVTFSGFPRLLHYDTALADWVDITDVPSVDTTAKIVCGLTSSFSPFVIGASALGAVGFHYPIAPVAGALNTAKGGSTVPLKFNVYGEGGVEITSPAGIGDPGFAVSGIGCESGAFETAVSAVNTGGTSLRYDTTARQFVQNWKTPGTPGCYLVKVTGNGLLVNARFKIK